jgi:hypothetical protein
MGDPTLMYDGIVDPTRTGGMAGNPMVICYSGIAGASFADIHADSFDSANLVFPNTSTDVTPFSCMGTAVPPVTIPGA